MSSHRTVRAACAAVALGSLGLLGVGTARAEISSTGGAIVEIAAPSSVREAAGPESNTQAFAFDERQDCRLGSGLAVDISEAGVVEDPEDLSPATLPAGTVLDSHFVTANPVGTVGPSGFRRYTGTITFDGEIVGVQVLSQTLSAGDGVCGLASVDYPTHGKAGVTTSEANTRGLELDQDFDGVEVAVSGDGKTLSFASSNHRIDQIRVFTSPGTPENPGAEGCTPGYWKQSHHYDSWVGYTPSTSFETVIGRNVFAGDPSFATVLAMGGGGTAALGRHTAAALLNAAHPDVDYGYTTSQVLSMVRAALDSGDAKQIESVKNQLDAANNGGCTLN